MSANTHIAGRLKDVYVCRPSLRDQSLDKHHGLQSWLLLPASQRAVVLTDNQALTLVCY